MSLYIRVFDSTTHVILSLPLVLVSATMHSNHAISEITQ